MGKDGSIGCVLCILGSISVILHAPEEEAIETVNVRSEQQEEPCHYEKVGDFYIVYRTRDRKVMKSVNYFKPDLKKFF